MNDLRQPSRHFIVGVVVLIIGLALLAEQLGYAEANWIFRLWPLILIYFGVNKLASSYELTGRFWGGFLTLLGVSFLLEEMGFSHIHFITIWPVFLICVGVLLILRRYENQVRPGAYPPPPPPGPQPGGGGAPPPEGPSTAPPTGEPQPAASAPPQAAPQPEFAPQAPPQAQTSAQAPPPPPPTAQWPYCPPGWDPNNWRHQRAWRRFERSMNRLSNEFNQRWDPRAGWAPTSGPEAAPGPQQNPNWQYGPRPHWDTRPGWSESSEPRLNDVDIFWGTRRRILSKNFLGGEIVAIFGGFEIDLTQADFPGNEIAIDIVAIFGGGEIRVPVNWDVVVENVGIFGGSHNKTWHPEQPSAGGPPIKRLHIKGISIFGGITIKN